MYFDTQSVVNAYTQSWLSFDYYSSSLGFVTSSWPAGSGPLYFYPEGPLANSVGGGTSNASPKVAGMIAGYLQNKS